MGKKKIAFFLSDTLLREIARLKQDKFYAESWADLYRYLIELGIKEAKKEAN